MNLNTVFGTKLGQTQGFLENGKRVPLSCIHVEESTVTQVKRNDTDGYTAAQIAFGKRNRLSKSTQGHLKKAKLQKKPRFFREIRLEDTDGVELGAQVKLTEVLKPGDIISVTGTSKGKGYAGVVKRHGFAGGPRTHGQSDRERAPGAIGQSATPSRVFKGKKMAGRMGNEQVTIKNLLVIDIEDDKLFVKGLIPGAKGGVIRITKIGEDKNFTPLFKEEKDNDKVEEEAKEEKKVESDSKKDEENEEAQEVSNEKKEDGKDSESKKDNESKVAKDSKPTEKKDTEDKKDDNDKKKSKEEAKK